MAAGDGLVGWGVHELAVVRGDGSAVDVTLAHLDRIDRVDATPNALVRLDAGSGPCGLRRPRDPRPALAALT